MTYIIRHTAQTSKKLMHVRRHLTTIFWLLTFCPVLLPEGRALTK